MSRSTTIPQRFELALAPVDLVRLQEAHEGAAEVRERRGFEMEAYTGDIFDVGFGPAVIDLEGIDIPADGVPIFRQHNPELFIGRSDEVEVGDRLTIRGALFEGVDEADEVARISDQGGRWQASIGIKIDFDAMEDFADAQQVAVNGRTLAGPFLLLRKTTLRESSFVPLGADGATSAVVLQDSAGNQTAHREAQNMDEKARIAELSAAFKGDPEFALEAITQGWTLNEAKAHLADKLQAQLADERAASEQALADMRAAHEQELAEARKARPAPSSAAAQLSGFAPAAATGADGSDPIGSFEAMVEAEVERLEARGSAGASRDGGLKLGRYANLRAQAVQNVALANPQAHEAYLDTFNAAIARKKGR